MRPADAGDLAVAPVPTLAPDPAQHVFAETDAVGPASTDTWSTFGDGGACGAHGGRRGTARGARIETVGGELPGSAVAPVIGGPCVATLTTPTRKHLHVLGASAATAASIAVVADRRRPTYRRWRVTSSIRIATYGQFCQRTSLTIGARLIDGL